jgi:CRISPR system Cascade subunit CasD
MSHTLLIRLQGPMQAWGVQSRFSVRETTREPTKSGVIGLLCAALGRDRLEPVTDLLALSMGVRVDREGKLMVDFHTAQHVLNAKGTVLKDAVLSNRYYLADAVFLVGLESVELELLERVQAALRRPRWLLSLGRRAFPASKPVWLENGLRKDQTLEGALLDYPWLIRKPATTYQQSKLPERLRFVFENYQGAVSRADAPVSYADRLFAQRRVEMSLAEPPTTFLEE